nr:hypothetical protein [Tanacetum cinerariifolium]
MDRKRTHFKRPRNAAWFKEKVMLAEAQESGQNLDEEQLAFLTDSGIPNGQAAQITILKTMTFQTEHLDAYDYDYDNVSNAKAVLMANLSNYGSDVILEVPHSKSYRNDLNNQIAKKLQADCDLKATSIVLQGLPPDVYAIINLRKVAKEIWDIVKLLMQGTKLSLQEKESEFMIIADAVNRPPMLEKSMYDSWKSRMELYIENRKNMRMILNSILNGPLVWPTIVEENGTTRTKKY